LPVASAKGLFRFGTPGVAALFDFLHLNGGLTGNSRITPTACSMRLSAQDFSATTGKLRVVARCCVSLSAAAASGSFSGFDHVGLQQLRPHGIPAG
jgi:hypothetical protein